MVVVTEVVPFIGVPGSPQSITIKPVIIITVW